MLGPKTLRTGFQRVAGGLILLVFVFIVPKTFPLLHLFYSCVQVNFDSHLKIVAEMTEIGETVERVDALIKDTKRFQKMCDVDIERAEEVIAIGTQ